MSVAGPGGLRGRRSAVPPVAPAAAAAAPTVTVRLQADSVKTPQGVGATNKVESPRGAFLLTCKALRSR
jgi:hypothetical protein